MLTKMFWEVLFRGAAGSALIYPIRNPHSYWSILLCLLFGVFWRAADDWRDWIKEHKQIEKFIAR